MTAAFSLSHGVSSDFWSTKPSNSDKNSMWIALTMRVYLVTCECNSGTKTGLSTYINRILEFFAAHAGHRSKVLTRN